MLEPDATIVDARSGAMINAEAIAGQSDISITNEPNSACPVLRSENARTRAGIK